MKNYSRYLTGLVAAPHTPLNDSGLLRLDTVPRQVEILKANGLAGAFICGSTGESHSLTTAERMLVGEAWKQALGSNGMKLIVHVGHNCIEDARALAAHAQQIGAHAIAIMAPCYFRPATVSDLLDYCEPVAAAAPDLPFYFYDIPALTGVSLSMLEFLKQGSLRIPNLAGLKFTSTDLMSLQQCLEFEDGRFNILFGVDESLLAGLALGVPGAVGSTFNYAAPLYHKLMAAFRAGDLVTAQALQIKSVKLVEILCHYGVLPAGKAIMGMLGADCGPARPPVRRLSRQQIASLGEQIKSLGILAQPLPEAVGV